MDLSQNGCVRGFVVFVCMLVLACNGKPKEAPKPREIVEQPQALSERTNENIRVALTYAQDNGGKVNDSIRASEKATRRTTHDRKNSEKELTRDCSFFGYFGQRH